MVDMTGEEFLNWLDGVKRIERVEWIIQGEDCWDADEISVGVTADGEKKEFFFGRAKWLERPDDFCKVCMAMIGNRVMKQVGLCDDLGPFTIEDDPSCVVNQTIRELQG